MAYIGSVAQRRHRDSLTEPSPLGVSELLKKDPEDEGLTVAGTDSREVNG